MIVKYNTVSGKILDTLEDNSSYELSGDEDILTIPNNTTASGLVRRYPDGYLVVGNSITQSGVPLINFSGTKAYKLLELEELKYNHTNHYTDHILEYIRMNVELIEQGETLDFPLTIPNPVGTLLTINTPVQLKQLYTTVLGIKVEEYKTALIKYSKYKRDIEAATTVGELNSITLRG